jgi:hypothetical protein
MLWMVYVDGLSIVSSKRLYTLATIILNGLAATEAMRLAVQAVFF